MFSLIYLAVGAMQLTIPQKLMETTAGVSLQPTAELITRAVGLWSIMLAVFMKSLVVSHRKNKSVWCLDYQPAL